MKTLVSSSHHVYLAADEQGKTRSGVEWVLALSAATRRIRTGIEEMRARAFEHVRFSASAAELRELAQAMLACADDLDAIEACTALTACAHARHANQGVSYLESITLSEQGILADDVEHDAY